VQSASIWRRTAVLAATGAAAFWLANLLSSLTPVAADYRDALSISYLPMLVEALLGGLVVGLVVSHGLARFYERIPTSNSIGKALLLTLAALIVATLLLEFPAKFLNSVDDSVRLFLIALAFNGTRFLALGLAIGYADDHLYRQLRAWRHTQ
jgi:hypothetical protein